MEHHSSASDILKDPHRHRSVRKHISFCSESSIQEMKLNNDKHTCRMAAATSICSLMREMQSNRKLSPFGAGAFEGIVTVTEI